MERREDPGPLIAARLGVPFYRFDGARFVRVDAGGGDRDD